jgi:hypothetical protein
MLILSPGDDDCQLHHSIRSIFALKLGGRCLARKSFCEIPQFSNVRGLKVSAALQIDAAAVDCGAVNGLRDYWNG